MNLIKNFLGLFVAIIFLASCGSETTKETLEPKVEEIVEKKVEEFDVRCSYYSYRWKDEFFQ